MRPAFAAARRGACLALVAPLLLAPSAARAFTLGTEAQRYSKAAFDRALAANEPVVVHFAAGWCPTCQVQKPILQRLLGDPLMKPLNFFVADYDRELALRNRYAVSQQSTLIAFSQGREVARSTGETGRDALAQLLRKAVQPPEAARGPGKEGGKKTGKDAGKEEEEQTKP